MHVRSPPRYLRAADQKIRSQKSSNQYIAIRPSIAQQLKCLNLVCLFWIVMQASVTLSLYVRVRLERDLIEQFAFREQPSTWLEENTVSK